MTQLADPTQGTVADGADVLAPTPHAGEAVSAPGTEAPQRPLDLSKEDDKPRSVSSWTAEDRTVLLGCAVASLCLTWLLYTQVLPLSGKVGFFLFWFVMYIGLYSAATTVTQPKPIVIDRIVSAVVQGAAAIIVVAVAWTLIYTFHRGYPAYKHWNFFTQDGVNGAALNPLTQGGIKHAIIGSLIELAIAVVISLPLGVATAVYLSEVGGRFSKIVRTVVEAMTALPDLIAGLFVYAFLIIALGGERNGLAAAIALSITMLPIIARSSEVVLRVVPGGLREASLALGSSQWRTVWSVVLPTAKSGLATALILGMARGIGESAPLLIVTRFTTYFNANPVKDPMNSLALYAVTQLRSPNLGGTIARGYGAASVLLIVVIVLFVIVRVLARQRGGKR